MLCSANFIHFHEKIFPSGKCMIKKSENRFQKIRNEKTNCTIRSIRYKNSNRIFFTRNIFKERKFANPTRRYYKCKWLFNRPNNSRWRNKFKTGGKSTFPRSHWELSAPRFSMIIDVYTRLQCSIISLSTVIPRPVRFSEIKFPAGRSVQIRARQQRHHGFAMGESLWRGGRGAGLDIWRVLSP